MKRALEERGELVDAAENVEVTGGQQQAAGEYDRVAPFGHAQKAEQAGNEAACRRASTRVLDGALAEASGERGENVDGGEDEQKDGDAGEAGEHLRGFVGLRVCQLCVGHRVWR